MVLKEETNAHAQNLTITPGMGMGRKLMCSRKNVFVYLFKPAMFMNYVNYSFFPINRVSHMV